ncbi:MAG: hypothetical protein NVSMB18_36720 [Acetobacteraceae bacterium]
MPDTSPPARWQPDRKPTVPPWPVPPLFTALGRGLMGRCPACGQTHAFNGYLRVVPECVVCGAPLGRVRADDAPPYFVIFAVGHIIVPLLFWMETSLHPPLWVHAAIWLPTSLILAAALLRPIKGATLGLMLKLGLVKADDE